MAPPTNAAGIDATANGQNSRHEKQPARANCTVAMAATSTFRHSAAGFITAGAKPKSAIAAR